ncbi:hypothetical protein [Flammeovirga sp. SJP92]|nr:hypothetical protein [Flammeovirga sp. SJP92]
MSHEKELLYKPATLRSQAISGTATTEERMELDAKMSLAIKYPNSTLLYQ